jgi:hypothetical protein
MVELELPPTLVRIIAHELAHVFFWASSEHTDHHPSMERKVGRRLDAWGFGDADDDDVLRLSKEERRRAYRRWRQMNSKYKRWDDMLSTLFVSDVLQQGIADGLLPDREVDVERSGR